ncbi:sugar/nucleoside kinase (ribokinase family) [Rhodovulum imhoffii]|uniref:Sugar/nucleoside kinase (Ribokinase family) n=1 Tax=Rhodovulum imhoffii TaxID=365340 RepID=A0A2T5BTQ4_9RHOB|nr:PfkB family carbohydrate kinase [Rhodovulum imhoffii]MBK5934116.1 kinase [Rhodovulum imhoffii]PTN02811.1 sugar/nucleoside kinase (ribokinase family) [Rhodovulum imhoffii]
MTAQVDIVCIGAVLWDIIGRAPGALQPGQDVPGRIIRQPGGVALNIALSLRRFGLRPALLSALGQDAEGEELLTACTGAGLFTEYIHRHAHPTDRYMAIEDADGLAAAIADAHGLERAGATILKPLLAGPLGRPGAPFCGTVILDGNLTAPLLAEIAHNPAFACADLRVVPASPGKATRLTPFLTHPRATLYLNRLEAEGLCARPFSGASEAAAALSQMGTNRALITDGPNMAADLHRGDLLTARPPAVTVHRITGAGDAFLAGHLAAEARGADRAPALRAALDAAARHISAKDIP